MKALTATAKHHDDLRARAQAMAILSPTASYSLSATYRGVEEEMAVGLICAA